MKIFFKEDEKMNSYPYAAAGMKKLFKAEIFMLIGEILSVLGLIFTFLVFANLAFLIFATICVVVGLVFTIIGYINSLIAVKKAGVDHHGYNSAFWCMIIALILSVVGSALALFITTGLGDDVVKLVSNVLEVVALILVIQATEKLLFDRNQGALAVKGEKVTTLIIIPYIISIVLRVITLFVLTPVVDVVLAIVSLVCAIVGYILYLSFIKKASKNLADAQ